MSESASNEGRVRVALVITELEVGGAERNLVSLATRLNPERFAPAVYSLAARPAEGRDQLVVQLEAAGIPTHFVGVQSSWQFFTALRRLRNLLAKQEPHVVQSFLFHANVVASIAAHQARAPAISTGIRVADPSRWRQRVERMFTRKAQRSVGVSQAVARFVAEQAGFPRERLHVIPNGIDISHYPAGRPADLSEFGVPAGRKAILFVGRMETQKGADWLAALAPQILAELAEHHMLLVGDGSLRSHVEKACRASSVASRIHFAGWRPDVPQIMAACQLLVLPSRWEGMPNALLEAMASGLPTVSTAAEGVLELLGESEFGRRQCVALGDKDAFAKQVVKIAENSVLATALGRANRIRVQQHFSLERMVARYEQLFESLGLATPRSR